MFENRPVGLEMKINVFEKIELHELANYDNMVFCHNIVLPTHNYYTILLS